MRASLKIKDVSDRLHISPRAIRFYEAKGLISPQKSPENQYRSFSEKDVWRLQTIVSLREIGMSVGDIRNVLRKIDEGDSDRVRGYLELQRALLYAQWVELKQILATLDHMIDLIDRKQALVLEDWFALAEASKRLREVRKNWRDRWNFDRQAATYTHFRPRTDLAALLAYGATGADVHTVIIDGEVVMRGRKLTRIDEEALLREADARAKRIDEGL